MTVTCITAQTEIMKVFWLLRPWERGVSCEFYTLYPWDLCFCLSYKQIPRSVQREKTMCCSTKYPYPSHGRLFGLNPPTPLEIPVKPHTFLQTFWLLRPPTPLEFPMTFHGVGMNIFWNCTMINRGGGGGGGGTQTCHGSTQPALAK